MVFQRIDGSQKIKRIRTLGVIKKATKFDGFYLKVDAECDLILYDRKSKEYFKVLKTKAVLGDEVELFVLKVDLDSPYQVEFKGKDD